jgi:hypothetical protein
MELLAYAFRKDAALVNCQGRHETRKSSRCLDGWGRDCLHTSVGPRVAPAPGKAIGSKVR